MRENIKKSLILFPILMGLALLFLLVKTRSPPAQAPLTEQARPVRIIEVPSVTVIPRATGYGNVAPSTVWEAVAEVSGKIIDKHPQLNKGDLMGANTVLLRIDPADYELAVAQAETNIQATRARLEQMTVEEANTRASLAIEEETLALGEKELARKRKLVSQGTVTRSDFEQEERNVLGQRQKTQNLNNILSLYPVERTRLEAELARYQAQLAGAKLDLERTHITLPFHGRIAQVNVERNQYVRQGDVLVVADGIDKAEVDAQFPMGRFRNLIRSERVFDVVTPTGRDIGASLGLTPRVWLRSAGFNVFWDARFARISDTLDPQTRTVGAIVEVDKPYSNIQPGVRPPLLKGLFVEVELRGRPRADRLVIPRVALHGDRVYLVDKDNRLEKRTIEVGLLESEFLTVSAGLQAGEQVVISDLAPAIDRMLLAPVLDQDAQARLIREAQAGEAPQ